jgi:hypothetical protein
VAIYNTTTQGDKLGSDNFPRETDWWDVETPEPEIEGSSLPLNVWVSLTACPVTPVVSVMLCTAQGSADD